ncbi:DUF262 domain-containing protein, partial [Carnobacterium jeotgali]
KFHVQNYSLNNLLNYVETDMIAVPEIQRPFVWKGRQVRDLIDSLYNGYPVGYLITWTKPNIRTRNGQVSSGQQLLIDGQQRITALMAAIMGREIITKQYQEKHIKIAFNPLAKNDEEKFAVQTPAHVKSSNWIPDISIIMKNDFDPFSFIPEYCQKNPEVSAQQLSPNIQKLLDIKNIQVGIIQLSNELEIEEVTEIFIRINSKGTTLNQADFAMSKISSEDKYNGAVIRNAIDYFCHAFEDNYFHKKITERDTNFANSDYSKYTRWVSEKKGDHIYTPGYSDILRVAFMSEFNKAKISDLVSLLSGRDFEKRIYLEEVAEDSFHSLEDGLHRTMNEHSYKNFELALQSAGFVNQKLTNSQMTLNFSYALYLLLKNNHSLNNMSITRGIQKWYVLTTLTSRYIGSPESAMNRDLRLIQERGFESFFKEVESAELSDTFWEIGLVQNLETNSSNSPYFNVYKAAMIRSNSQGFLTKGITTKNLLDIIGDIHHIFPKNYLQKNGFNNRNDYNQIANYTFLDRETNIKIGNKSPRDYIGTVVGQIYSNNPVIGDITNEMDLNKNLEQNSIPFDLGSMDETNYKVFLEKRRKLMAMKIKNYYYSL